MKSKIFVTIGRLFLVLAFAALMGAWVAQVTSQPIFGMPQAHLFSDATVLALLGIGCLIDSMIHKQDRE